MLNLIRSDLYRLFRMTSFWVVNIFLFIEAVFICIGMTMDNASSFTGNLEILSSGLPLMFTGVFVALFTASEYKNGYIKNIAGNIPDRLMLLASKLVVSAVCILTAFAITLVTLLVGGFIVFGASYSFEGLTVGSFLAFIGIQLLLHLAVCAIIILVTALTRSGAAGCITSFVISTGFLSELITLAYTLFAMNDILPKDINPGDFMVMPYLMQVTASNEQSFIIAACIAGAAYFIVFNVLSAITLKKKDI